jgi:hypothetical protein
MIASAPAATAESTQASRVPGTNSSERRAGQGGGVPAGWVPGSDDAACTQRSKVAGLDSEPRTVNQVVVGAKRRPAAPDAARHDPELRDDSLYPHRPEVRVIDREDVPALRVDRVHANVLRAEDLGRRDLGILERRQALLRRPVGDPRRQQLVQDPARRQLLRRRGVLLRGQAKEPDNVLATARRLLPRRAIRIDESGLNISRRASWLASVADPLPPPGTSRSTLITWFPNLVAALRQMPRARWQCLNF